MKVKTSIGLWQIEVFFCYKYTEIDTIQIHLYDMIFLSKYCEDTAVRKKGIKIVAIAMGMSLLSGCSGKKQTDDLTITIPEYEKMTYTTEKVMRGDIEPELILRLEAKEFRYQEYHADHDEMKVDQVYVKQGDAVKAGDTLITFQSDDIDKERQQYENRVEEDALLIDHYTRLDQINQTDANLESIKELQKDQEIARLYIDELDAKLETYTIKAEEDGVVSSVSDMLEYGTVYAYDPLVKLLYGSDKYTTTTDDDYDFQVGQTYTATFGVGSYDIVLSDIEETATDSDAGAKRKLSFVLADSTGRPSSSSLNLVIKKDVIKDVLYVPQDAIMSVKDETYVYQVDDQGFRHGVPVKTGSTVNGYTVIEEGLQEGDKVVVSK